MLKFLGFFVVILLECSGFSINQRNNVCKKLEYYYIRDISPDCWYDPDVTATAYELAKNHGYKLDNYETVTEDGYILTVFRVSPKTKHCKGIVYLQHPAASSASIWLDLGNQSLAFLLADRGYDVWLGNFRGTTYSRKHTKLKPRERKYWDFSFHEMAMYDLPAMLHLVSKKTDFRDKIIYVGHSVGTTTAFIYASLLPANASAYVKTFIFWSPVTFPRHVKSIPLIIMAPFADFILVTINVYLLNSHQFPINTLIAGPDPHFSPARLPITIYQNFAGFSLKSTVHYLQLMRDKGRFQRFNYGKVKNKKLYGSVKPPFYPLKNINVSMTLMYGGNDYCAVKKDVLYTYNNRLPKSVRCGIFEIAPYNHFDFHYATDVKDLVYQKTIDIIDRVINGTYVEMCVAD
ncbi:hypothetical protein ILUMI_12833 [Ignelater luminosus]|uniref:Lipase n=1 Tax=Ignelater luminosus TaxID=2038154 RepID=A0A8K0G6E6_IGNLU|nr:hypothetical protein ILUMI_12833 [Ignelater luminosus]